MLQFPMSHHTSISNQLSSVSVLAVTNDSNTIRDKKEKEQHMANMISYSAPHGGFRNSSLAAPIIWSDKRIPLKASAIFNWLVGWMDEWLRLHQHSYRDIEIKYI